MDKEIEGVGRTSEYHFVVLLMKLIWLARDWPQPFHRKEVGLLVQIGYPVQDNEE